MRGHFVDTATCGKLAAYKATSALYEGDKQSQIISDKVPHIYMIRPVVARTDSMLGVAVITNGVLALYYLG